MMMQRKPLILEEWEDRLVIELAGEVEDIEEDRSWLASYEHVEIRSDWGAMIRSISQARAKELRSKRVDPIALQLLDQLRDKITA
jgi:hypothetical protein